ncbi:MAG: LCP family protein [Chloroflexi bacterium]|jgi:LCP family protein required for cell wall assembly|nr:LCP family protein [Chloroflexota bacterium]HOT25565.1 LCP family protein [Anaerolineaceae bacterium]HQK03457.1 LCP family protein [Anaerolineaceae bacterium]
MKKKLLIVLLVLAAALLIGGGLFLGNRWNKPISEAISLPSRTASLPAATETSPSAGTETPAPTQTDEPAAPLPSTTFTATAPRPQCGGPEVMYILAAGIDTDDPNYTYGLSDVIRVIRVDFVTPRVTVLTIPRDLKVDLVDIIESKAAELPNAKLNQAYFYGSPGMNYFTGTGGGMGLLARVLAHNYDLYVDNYAAVNMVAFEEIIDAMGGVDVYLNEPLDGRPLGKDDVDPYKQGQGYFPKGWNHLTGFDALSFVRIRDRYGEVARTDHQTLLICGIQEKLRSPEIITSLPKMVLSVLNDIQTDLTIAQIRQLICLLPKLSRENIQFVRFPDEWMVQGRADIARLGNTFVWDIPVEKIVEFINAFENDTIPVVVEEGGTTCPVNPAKK